MTGKGAAPRRVLGRLRLSRVTDESTSIERQREVIQQWSDANGHSVVGWAEDLDVSGSMDPFETPALGPWLGDRAPEWDVICAWKLDRLGRNAIQLSKLFGWCADHGKTVVSCSESIDLGTWAGRMLAGVIAGLAEGELEAIRERQVSSRRKLRQSARWPGGKPPYGYTAVKRPEGGWSLMVDPLASKMVERIVNDAIDGKPLTRLARELTAEGVLTPAHYHASVRAGKPLLSDPGADTGTWMCTALRNMLRSKALRGYAHHNGETVRDDDGMPVQLAEPLVTLDEWELIQARLDHVLDSRRDAARPQSSPLAGLAYCVWCELPLHHTNNSVKRGARRYLYRYYRCQSRKCPPIPADYLETLFAETFVGDYGDVEVRERVWVPGDAHEAEKREAVTALDEITAGAGRAQSATAKERLQKQISAWDAKLVELESAPAREARWEYRTTGGTYRELWEISDPDARREMLRKSGISVAAGLFGVDGRRSKHNPGAFRADIRVPADWPMPEPVPVPSDPQIEARRRLQRGGIAKP